MKGGKFLKNFVIVILLIFFIYQIIAAFDNPFTTVSASYYETFKGIDTEAFLVKDETIIKSNIGGVKSFSVKNGERVSKNGVIANVYDNEEISNTYSQIKDLNEQIDSLEELSLYHDGTTDVNVITQNIDSKIIEFSEANKQGKFDLSENLNAELFALLSSKQSLLGLGSDVDGYISSLKSKVKALKASVPSSTSRIKSSVSGYFVSDIDGYETVLNTKNILDLTPNKFKNLKAKKVSSNSVCKIVSDYKWYFAAEVTADEALKLKENNYYVVLTNQSQDKDISAQLIKLNSNKNSNKVIAIFSFSNTDGELASIRTMPITIVLERYKGISVPNRSVRMVDEKLGVYIIQAGIIKFKEIKVLYTTDTYTVCEIDKTGNSNALRLYDEVIDKGKNLYDGKAIN